MSGLNIGVGNQPNPYETTLNPSIVQPAPTLPDTSAAPTDSITTAGVLPPGTVGYDAKPQAPKLTQDPRTNTQEVTTTTTEGIGTSSKIFDPPANVLQAAQNALVNATDIVNIQKELVAKMPEGPEKARFMDFLAKVSAALSELAAAIQEMAMSDSQGAKDRSQAKLEVALSKLEEQNKKSAEIKAKENQSSDKQKQMDNTNKAMSIVGVVFQCLMFLILAPILLMTTGPLALIALSFMLINIISTCQKIDNPNAKSVMDHIMEGVAIVAQAFVDLANEISKAATGHPLPADAMNKAMVGIKAAMTMIMVAVVIASCPVAAVFAPDAIMSMIQSSHIISDIAKATGSTPEQAAMAEMIASIVLGCIAMIAGIAASVLCPASFLDKIGGMVDKLGKMVTKGAKMAADAIAKMMDLSDKAAKTLTNVMRGVFKVLSNPDLYINLTMVSLQAVNTTATYKYHNLMAEIALLRSSLDATIELKDALISILKKMIQQLLDSMQGLMQDASNVSSLLKSQKEGLSEVLTNLQG